MKHHLLYRKVAVGCAVLALVSLVSINTWKSADAQGVDFGSAKVYDIHDNVLGYVTSTSGLTTTIDMLDKRLDVLEKVQIDQTPTVFNSLLSQQPFNYRSSDCSGRPYAGPVLQANPDVVLVSSLLIGPDHRFYIVDQTKSVQQNFVIRSFLGTDGVCNTTDPHSIPQAYPVKDVTSIINSYASVGRIGI